MNISNKIHIKPEGFFNYKGYIILNLIDKRLTCDIYPNVFSDTNYNKLNIKLIDDNKYTRYVHLKKCLIDKGIISSNFDERIKVYIL